VHARTVTSVGSGGIHQHKSEEQGHYSSRYQQRAMQHTTIRGHPQGREGCRCQQHVQTTFAQNAGTARSGVAAG